MSENSVMQSDESDNIPGALTVYDMVMWASHNGKKEANESYDLLLSLPGLLHDSIDVVLYVEKPRSLRECSTALRLLSCFYCMVEAAISQIQKDTDSENEVALTVTH